MSRNRSCANARPRATGPGPIAPYLEAFAASLIAQQYSAFCVHHKLYGHEAAAAHLRHLYRRSSCRKAVIDKPTTMSSMPWVIRIGPRIIPPAMTFRKKPSCRPSYF